VVICLQRGADLHMSQLMPLPLTVSCFSKIQIGFTFLAYRPCGPPRVVRDKAPLNGCVCFRQIKMMKSTQLQHSAFIGHARVSLGCCSRLSCIGDVSRFLCLLLYSVTFFSKSALKGCSIKSQLSLCMDWLRRGLLALG